MDDNEALHAASHAIDLDMDTSSNTVPGPDGTLWFKVKLDNTHCIHQVVRYYDGNPLLTWTCSSTDCSTCTGSYCSFLTLTVSTERASTDGLPTVSDCKHGDTVMIQRTDDLSSFSVYEVAIKGKQGEIECHTFGPISASDKILSWFQSIILSLRLFLYINMTTMA